MNVKRRRKRKKIKFLKEVKEVRRRVEMSKGRGGV